MTQSLFYLEEDDNDNVDYGGGDDDNDNDNVDYGDDDGLMLRLGNGGSYVTMRKAQLVPASQRV